MSAQDNLSPKQFNLYFRKSDSSRGLHEVTAYKGDDQVGELKWRADTGEIHNIEVEGHHQREGIATQMYKYAQRQRVIRPQHSAVRTEEGDLWAQSVGGKLPRRIEPS